MSSRFFLFGLFGLLALAGCSAPSDAPCAEESAAAGATCGELTQGVCVRSEEQYVPAVAACYRVTAACGSVLANCFGEGASSVTNEVSEHPTPSSAGYIVTGFDVPAGGCFYYYACSGASFGEVVPAVGECP